MSVSLRKAVRFLCLHVVIVPPIAPASAPHSDKRVRVSALLMERRAKKSDCRATTKERPNMPPFFPRHRRCVVVIIVVAWWLAMYRKLHSSSFITSFRHPHHERRLPYSPSVLTSQRNITTISIPADIAGR